MKPNLFNNLLVFFFLLTPFSFAQNISNQLQLQPKVTFKNPNIIKLTEDKFTQKKLKPILFKSFTYSDFKINKNEIIKLKNGKSISAEKFLDEVNEIEEKLNEFGYSLRDEKDEIVLGEFNYSYNILDKQRNLLNFSDKKLFNDKLKITPCGLLTEEELVKALNAGKPKQSWPINQNKNWSMLIGNNDFGVEIKSSFKFNAEEKNSDLFINSDSNVEVSLNVLVEKIPALKLTDRIFNKPYQNQISLFVLNNPAINDIFSNSTKRNYYRDLDWQSGIEFSLGPFSLSGKIISSGRVGLVKSFNIQKQRLSEEITPYVDVDFFGELSTGFVIAEAGIEGKLKLINDTLSIKRNLELKNVTSDIYFDLEAKGVNDLTALKGKIYAYLNIYLPFGTKKFILIFYNNPEGIVASENLFNISYTQPTKRDRELWLEISRISGITNYTARNEKNDVVPKSFIISVEAAGQNFVDTLADWNKDGTIETPVQFKIPMLSSLSIPIKISVKEKYQIGNLDFETELDFVKGEEKEIQFCYNPANRKINGVIESEEEKLITLTGDTNYFGERNHSITFRLSPNLKFKTAPTKTK